MENQSNNNENNQQSHLLSDEIKYGIITLYKQQKIHKEIIEFILEEFGREVHHTTLSNIISRYNETGDINNRWNSKGRPKLLDDKCEEMIKEQILLNRKISISEIKINLGLEVSKTTIQRSISGFGYQAYQSEENYQFSITKLKSRIVWGAVSIQGTGPVVNAEGSLNADGYLDLYRYRLRLYYPGLYPGQQIFQDNNALIHRANVVNQWFHQYNIQILNWPPSSHDLNIIENVWSYLKFKIEDNNFQNEDDLSKELLFKWQIIPVDFIQNQYFSLPNRIKRVIQIQGTNTKY